MSAAPEPNSDGSAIPELYYTGFLGLYVIGLHNGRKGIGFVWSWNGKGEKLLEFELVGLTRQSTETSERSIYFFYERRART